MTLATLSLGFLVFNKILLNELQLHFVFHKMPITGQHFDIPHALFYAKLMKLPLVSAPHCF